jgi:arylsulfatase A-like enzyme
MKNLLLCLLLAFLALSAKDKAQQKHPNIVWIVCEDMSPHLGSYGEKIAQTPVLDQLAKEGVRYTNAFSTAGVCAPSRAAIITGCYQTSIDGHNMRTLGAGPLNKSAYPPGYQSYSAVVPVGVKCFSEYLRAAGYYCTNNNKEDYQFEAPVTAWDESGNNAHWRKRKDPQQPFFAVFNIFVTHESQVWARNKEPLLVDPAKVEVPPYYVDNEITRKTIARFLTNVMLMDKQAGELIQQLKDDGVYDDTIIFFYSDHGDGMPFVKRELYDRGLRVPMIIKAPFLRPGTIDNQLISFVDLAPSVL